MSTTTVVFGSSARRRAAEPNHQLGVEVAHAHAVAGDARAELLDEQRDGDVLQLDRELRLRQLLESQRSRLTSAAVPSAAMRYLGVMVCVT